jgi:DNA repair protein RadC
VEHVGRAAPCHASDRAAGFRTSAVWRVERDPARYRALVRWSHRIGPIDNASKLADVMAPITDRESLENGWMVLLDIHGYLQGIDPFARGDIDGVSVPIPAALQLAAVAQCRYGILVHNHPSGNPAPSDADVELTREMAQAFGCAGMLLLDHVIMGAGQFYSFREGSQWRATLLTP